MQGCVEGVFRTEAQSEQSSFAVVRPNIVIPDRPPSGRKSVECKTQSVDVNPESNRPYPYTVIERVMKDVMHFSPIPNKSAKQQALECIKQLRDHIPLERAKIKISISVPSKDSKPIKEYLEREHVEIVSQDWGDSVKWICLIFPGLYRSCNELVQSIGKGRGIFDVLELNVQEEGEQSIEDAILFKSKRAGNEVEEETKEERAPIVPAFKSATTTTTTVKTGLQCSTCGGNFPDKNEHRQHFRSDWHRYNLKRKAKKQSIVEEALFEDIGAEDLEEYFQNIL